MATRAVLIIAFDEDDPKRLIQTMDDLRELIDPAYLPNPSLYAAIDVKAEEVLALFKDD